MLRFRAKGFSLIQVMIATSVLSGLALSSAKLSQNMFQTQSIVTTNLEENELKSYIRMI